MMDFLKLLALSPGVVAPELFTDILSPEFLSIPGRPDGDFNDFLNPDFLSIS